MDPTFGALVLVRWVHFCAIVLLFGAALFRAYAPRDVARAPTARVGPSWVKASALIALASGIGWLAATIVNMTGLEGLGDPDTLHAFFFQTIFGPIEAARIVLLLAVAIIAFAPLREPPRIALIATTSGALLVSQAWLGHAAEGGNTLHGAVMIAVYAVHVLAAAAWLGGLPPLLARLVALRRQDAPAAPALRLLSRYSRMATLAVVLILGSGVANAAFRVEGRIGAFVSTDYGDVLVAKLALVALMLGFAAANRLVVMPRLRAPGRYGRTPIAFAVASIGCEIVLGALVLGAAAVLGITPPPA